MESSPAPKCIQSSPNRDMLTLPLEPSNSIVVTSEEQEISAQSNPQKGTSVALCLPLLVVACLIGFSLTRLKAKEEELKAGNGKNVK